MSTGTPEGPSNDRLYFVFKTGAEEATGPAFRSLFEAELLAKELRSAFVLGVEVSFLSAPGHGSRSDASVSEPPKA